MQWQRDIEVLTPLFNRGAYQDTPEIRVPSIRGMVRWWFRQIGGTVDEEKEAFGGMTHFGQRLQGQVNASRLVFRVSNARCERASPNPPTLPHKQGGQASPQAAFASGTTFHLEVFSRFGELEAGLQQKVENALEVWLLLGALGLRANRSGGNVWPAGEAAPRAPAELRASLVRNRCSWPLMLAGKDVGSTLDHLRAAATDTVNGAAWVFGYARGRDRLASALKFKIVRFGHELRLLAFAPEQRVLDEARRSLNGHRSKPETWQPI
jgi:CRISPR/Cas system CMR-associated protein Cmr1 (group 7 of RAMP superfamily)